MIRQLWFVFCALVVVAGCNRTDKPALQDGPAGADLFGRQTPAQPPRQEVPPPVQENVPGALPPQSEQPKPVVQVPGAMPEHHDPIGQTPVPSTIPDRREQIGQVPGATPPTATPDRRAADDSSKYKEYKTPLVRALMEALDQAGGELTTAEVDSAKKTLRENDAILDKAPRDMTPLMKRANNRRAAIRVTPPHPQKPAVEEFKPVNPNAPKDGPIPPNVPGATETAPPAAGE